jgi:hypothetical protein
MDSGQSDILPRIGSEYERRKSFQSMKNIHTLGKIQAIFAFAERNIPKLFEKKTPRQME